jgi:hypothetical protein
VSKALTIAQAMADRLNALATLPDVDTLVWKQKDLSSEMAAKLGKSAGAVIVILYEGFKNPDANGGGRLNVTRSYTLSVFSRPVRREGTATAADDIVEIAAAALHNWEPAEAAAGIGEIHVKSCDLRPDPLYLIYDLDVEVLSRL